MAAALSACWLSAEPLIGPDNASKVAFGGPFRPDDEDVTVRAVALPDGSYELADGTGGFRAFYLAVGNGWYIVEIDMNKSIEEAAAQAGGSDAAKGQEPDDDGPYIYNLMHMTERGDLASYHMPCDEQTAALPGVAREMSGADQASDTCILPELAVLKQAAAGAIARIESGELKIEAKILRAIPRE